MNFKLLLTLVIVCALLGSTDAGFFGWLVKIVGKVVGFVGKLFGGNNHISNTKIYANTAQIGNNNVAHNNKIYHKTPAVVKQVPAVQPSNRGEEKALLLRLSSELANGHSLLMRELQRIDSKIETVLDAQSMQREYDPNHNPQLFEFIQHLGKYFEKSRKIDNLFDSFELYSSKMDLYNNLTVQNYVENVLGHNSDSPMYILNEMHQLLIGSDGLFQLTSETIVADYIVCTRGKSALQFLHTLYSYMTYAEMKGLIVISYAFEVMQSYQKGDFKQEYMDHFNKLTGRFDYMFSSMISVSEKINSRLWICDSPSKRIGSNYLQFIYFIQAQVERIPHRQTCSTLDNTVATYNRDQKCQLYHDEITERTCRGKYVNCLKINTTHTEYCFSQSHHRRYDYLVFKTGSDAEKRDCNKRRIIKQNSASCIDCVCYCDDYQKADSERFISLDETISNLRQNMVVTGLRFAKRNRAIVLEIQQAQIGPGGFIVDNTENWIESTTNKQFTLTPTERTIAVDVLEGLPDYVVTGIRFSKDADNVHLEAQVTPLNKETGKLDTQLSKWIKNERTREKIPLENLNSPLAATASPVMVSTGSNSLRVTHTSLEQDSAQTTVPFFDAREVKSSPLVPLQGVGLVYKRASDRFGGFLAPIIVGVDYSEYLKVDEMSITEEAFLGIDVVLPSGRKIVASGGNRAALSMYVLITFSWSMLLYLCFVIDNFVVL